MRGRTGRPSVAEDSARFLLMLKRPAARGGTRMSCPSSRIARLSVRSTACCRRPARTLLGVPVIRRRGSNRTTIGSRSTGSTRVAWAHRSPATPVQSLGSGGARRFMDHDEIRHSLRSVRDAQAAVHTRSLQPCRLKPCDARRGPWHIDHSMRSVQDKATQSKAKQRAAGTQLRAVGAAHLHHRV